MSCIYHPVDGARRTYVGLVENYGYGWYATLIWVPIYHLVVRRQQRTT